jgi:ABC-type Na+ efflux pump permease subunit
MDVTPAFRAAVAIGIANGRSMRPGCSIKTGDLAMADPLSRCYAAPMAVFLSTFILPVAVGAVALVLLMGLVNMMRGGSPNRSQQLMRLRVLLQFVAIIVIMVTIWAMGR